MTPPAPPPVPDPLLAEAVRRTLAERTGRFAHSVLAVDDGLAALAEGAYDLGAGRVAALTRVMTSSVDDAGTRHPDPLGEPVASVVEPGVLHQAGAPGEHGARPWHALEHPGLAASPLAALWWLLGGEVVAGAGAAPASLRVLLHPSAAVAAAPPDLRRGAAASLEEAGLLPADVPVPADVRLDARGRVASVDLVLPGAPGPRMRLELHDLGAPVRVEVPDGSRASTLEAFVREVTRGADGPPPP